jgi:hypothetical protein
VLGSSNSKTELRDERFPQRPLNGCGGCHADFTSLETFDRHRVGTYEYTLEQGLKLDPPREDGRRCLSPEEMQAKSWERNDKGRWTDPARSDRARLAFSASGGSPERPGKGSDEAEAE